MMHGALSGIHDKIISSPIFRTVPVIGDSKERIRRHFWDIKQSCHAVQTKDRGQDRLDGPALVQYWCGKGKRGLLFPYAGEDILACGEHLFVNDVNGMLAISQANLTKRAVGGQHVPGRANQIRSP